MKQLHKIRIFFIQELKATRTESKKFVSLAHELFLSWYYVLSKPVNVLYGLLAGALTVSLAIWSANISIINQLFESSALSIGDQLTFMFSMLSTTLRNIAPLQFWLIWIFGIFSVVLWSCWLEALKLQHDDQRHRNQFAGVLIFTLITGALGIIGISLITPVITREGLSVLISSHYSGTLILLLALILEIKIVLLFGKKLHGTALKRENF